MPGERKRRHHQRSRNGCITCKQRHMRCDETKPYCRNCLRSGGGCGYTAAESSKPGSSYLELTEEQMQMQWTPSSSESPLSPGRADPFETLGITQCYETKMLFQHYLHYRILTRTPTKRPVLGGEAAELVKSDSALMHTTILLAANHWVLVGGNPATVSSAFYHHKLEAIRIINERLGDPVRAWLVGTVGAVAGMALAEITCGSTEVATHHLNGLEHLLKLGGVLHTTSMCGLVHRMILLADTLVSAATNSLPRFSGIAVSESSRRASTSTFISSSDLVATSSIHSCTFTSGPLSDVDRDLAQIFHDLQHLSERVAANDRGELSGEPYELIDSVSTTERNIDLLIHERVERVDTSEHHVEFAGAILEKGNPIPVGACARAATLFVYLFLRRIPIHSPVFDWMVDVLRQDLDRTEESIRHLYPPELLFWILFIAGTASLGRPERSLYRSRLVKYRDHLKLDGWNSAKLVLEKMAWLETPGESLGGSLWEELESLR